MNMVVFQNKNYSQIKKQAKLDIWTKYFEKKQSQKSGMERDSDNTRFNKNSSNSQKYVKIAKNQTQNLQNRKQRGV